MCTDIEKKTKFSRGTTYTQDFTKIFYGRTGKTRWLVTASKTAAGPLVMTVGPALNMGSNTWLRHPLLLTEAARAPART